MRSQVANIRRLEQQAERQLPLNTKTELMGVRGLQPWINRIDIADWRQHSGAPCRIGEVPVFELRSLQKWRNIHPRENDVTFRPVIKHSVSATNYRFLVRGVSESEARRESALARIEPARCAVRHRQHRWAVSI